MTKDKRRSTRRRVKRAESIIPRERITSAIYLIRGDKVLLDSDLALMYGVPTGTLNQAVKRNASRFPADFMFQLTASEMAAIRRDDGGETAARGGRRYRPYAFTEHGVAMLSSVLRSDRAVAVNIDIVRAFVRMRQVLSSHRQLAAKVKALEGEFRDTRGKHAVHIQKLYSLFDAYINPPEPPKKSRIGFRAPDAVD